jgi:hypothetical protein
MLGKNQEHGQEEDVATGKYFREINYMPVEILFKPWKKQVNTFKDKS